MFYVAIICYINIALHYLRHGRYKKCIATTTMLVAAVPGMLLTPNSSSNSTNIGFITGSSMKAFVAHILHHFHTLKNFKQA